VQFLSNVLNNFHNIDYNSVVVDGKFSVTGIPYMANTEEFDKLLTVASQGAKASDLPTILMLHQTPTRLYNTFIPSTVDIDDPKLDAFDYVFMGHIHSYQDFGNKRYMVGNPLIQDEQDFGIDKGFLTIEDDGNVGFVKLLTPLDSIADSLRRKKKVVLKETKELAKKEIDHRLFSESIKDQFMAYCDNTIISDELKVIGLNLIK
jgi:DNA repair exonuclease SbcCD nuclease subunit